MPEKRKKQAPKDIVFALDIGTRSVIGLVAAKQEDGRLDVLDYERLEYAQRAMRDGQIEDIAVVSDCIRKVRGALEDRLGYRLKEVGIAAAGRALQTRRLTVERKLNRSEVINTEIIHLMELEAIEQAQADILSTGGERRDFYCVGHTIVGYALDGYEMSEVVGHYGNVCVMTIIAAFLPRSVVESLYSAVEKSGLEVQSLTLEPIAAMNLVIPQEVRMLNLALVDIGAGTSDIALSKAGEVVAYDMVTVAGDEVTETLMKQYLVDFATAEQIKRQLLEQEEITFHDILGIEQTAKREDVLQTTTNIVESLVDVVSDKIVELNGSAPTALFLVGGGSLYAGLEQRFAQRLGLDEKRVTVGGGSWVPKLVTNSEQFMSPEFVTPLGIALTSFLAQPFSSAAVTVNGKKVRQFSYEGLRMMDVLVLSGHYKYDQLQGRVGKRLRYSLNGQVRTMTGGLAKPAKITLNGTPVGLEEPVRPGDVIELIPAENGADAHLTAGEIVADLQEFTIYYDEQPYTAGKWLLREGKALAAEDAINEGDHLQLLERLTVQHLAEMLGITGGAWQISGETVTMDTLLHADDRLTYLPSVGEAIDENESTAEMIVSGQKADIVVPEKVIETEPEPITPEPVAIEPEPPAMEERQAEIEPVLTVMLNGKPLDLPLRPGETPMLFDLFNHIDEDILNNRDHQLKCLLNGQEQPFTTHLKPGDHVEIG